jgi:hypothetical protein
MKSNFERRDFTSNSKYIIENWIENIKEYTFKTYIIPLKLEEAKSLMKYKEVLKFLKEINNNNEYNNQDYEKNMEKILNKEEINQIISIENKIDEFVEKTNNKKIFVKLSQRSPKDSSFTGEKVKRILKERIKNSKVKADSIEAEIEDSISFLYAMCYSLCVTSGKEALKLLLNSQRIYIDLKNAELMNNKNEFNVNIIIREWEDINPEYEFRAFINNSDMTCCTQYHNTCFVPELYKNKNYIKEFIYKFWDEKIKKLVDIEKYSIDFVLSKDLKNIRVK